MNNNIGTSKNRKRNLRTILLCIGGGLSAFFLSMLDIQLTRGTLDLSKGIILVLVLAGTALLIGTLWYEYIKRDEFEKAILNKAITFTVFVSLLGVPWYLLGMAEIVLPFHARPYLFLLCLTFLGYFVNYGFQEAKNQDYR